MSKKLRRFEVLLPLTFNDGRRIPKKLRGEAVVQIVREFGAASAGTEVIEGQWTHAGVIYRDNLVRVAVDIPDTVKNREWMRAYRREWKSRLEQLELWMVSFRVELEVDDD